MDLLNLNELIWFFFKTGYAGVGVYSKTEPIDVTYGIGEEQHDDEGRCITLEYDNFYLVNVYVPNAGKYFHCV